MMSGNIFDRRATPAEAAARSRDDVWLSPSSVIFIIPEYSDSVLSGAPKVFENKDASGTPYYYKAYPTK